MQTPRILIVEDQNILVFVIKSLLHNLGYEVCETARNGKDAIEKAKAVNPDLVLMDIRLKGTIDGIEASKRIREVMDIPIVYTTGDLNEDLMKSVNEINHTDWLIKPFGKSELYEVIERCINRTKSRFFKQEIKKGTKITFAA